MYKFQKLLICIIVKYNTLSGKMWLLLSLLLWGCRCELLVISLFSLFDDVF